MHIDYIKTVKIFIVYIYVYIVHLIDFVLYSC